MAQIGTAIVAALWGLIMGAALMAGRPETVRVDSDRRARLITPGTCVIADRIQASWNGVGDQGILMVGNFPKAHEVIQIAFGPDSVRVIREGKIIGNTIGESKP